ncbi:MAG TPA: TIR domain-containing protein [Steroidobacteraceae bacterium]|nr:TIR domain-containing protein [Steroidobacteraceae bacterium]
MFLSYASQDAEAAQKICDALRAAGIEVWFDKSELRGGEVWDRQIREQVHDCRLFIPVISANTEARDEGYFRREWGLATDRTRDMAEKRAFLIPVVIDNTPERGSSVPEKFHQIQWTRLPAGVTSPAFVARVTALLGVPAPVATAQRPAPTLPSTSSPQTRDRPSLWIVLGLVAVGIVGGGGWFALRHSGLHRHAQADAASQSQSTVTQKSIAVLPFADLSEKHDQEYFADGMAEEILDILAKIPGLRVIGRTSSFQFKGRSADLRQIGETLGANYVLDGSVRKAGDQVRVSAQLIDARDGAHVWSESYDRSSGNVLALEDEIAAGITRALEITLLNDARSRTAETTDARAHDLYLRALRALDAGSESAVQEAAATFTQVLEIEPRFAPAAVGLAEAYVQIGQEAWIPPPVAFERAREAVKRALSIDPNSGAAYAALAWIQLIYDWDWAGAADSIRRARSLGAGVSAIAADGALAATLGKWPEAIEHYREALALDPRNAEFLTEVASLVYLRSGRCADAEISMREALRISPRVGTGNWFLGIALLCQRRFADALAAFQQETIADGQYEGSAMAHNALGNRTESDKFLSLAIQENGTTWRSAIARVYAYRGDVNNALDWLEQAYAARDEDLYFIRSDPLLTNIATEPRYRAILRRMNLPE